jgi:RNA polymerase sigma-70 factor (ECF subfamily)
MPSSDDRQFVRDALAQHRAALLRFAASLVGSSQASDVVQDTFLALCKAERSEVEGRLAAWLFSVCRNRAIDLRRQQARLAADPEDDEIASPASGPSSSVERRQALSRVERIVEELPSNQRQVLLLKFSGGLSYKEIAEVMGLSVSNVGFVLHTAIKRLREQLAQEVETADLRSAL